MYRNKKIVVVTPAGRQRYMEVQKNHIISNPLVDEWQIWKNTNVKSDIEYMEFLKNKCPEKVKIISLKNVTGRWNDSQNIVMVCTICKFFKSCINPDHVYLRLDDDIVWMEKNAIENIINFRIDNPQYFLVYGNIINNAICDHLHQRLGGLKIDELVNYQTYGKDNIAYYNGFVAEKIHRCLIHSIRHNEIFKYLLSKWILTCFERVSINVISWLGEEFALFDGEVYHDEETWLSCMKPKEINKPNAICGTALFSHFSFYTQRNYMDKTDILSIYKEISEKEYPNYV